MAPALDWGKLMKVDPDVLPNQERLAEKMLKTLSQVTSADVKGETNENLIQLFRITQSLMKMKSQEVDLALEEAEKAGEEQAKTGSKTQNLYSIYIVHIQYQITNCNIQGEPKVGGQ
ncbi:centrosomal protein of 290 kDa-like [Pyxicephalus adspersus]|uniref:centrosomal protein of 290 kDa-like n=1 Tax=Pyxicephalus adspersus TaxID=30357 RepID=UPI003B5B5898